MPASKQNWDTRTWLIGILGGTAGGLLMASPVYNVLLRWLSSFIASSLTEHHVADAVLILSTFIIVLVLPGFLSSLARRMTFLWGVLPLCTAYIVSQLENRVRDGTSVTVKDFLVSVAVLIGCLLISSGPVSLIRWLRVRRHHATLDSCQAMREAAAMPQEGIWPPPPDYRE